MICVLAALEGYSGGFLDGDRVEDSLRLSKALERLYGGFRARNARGSPWETSGGLGQKTAPGQVMGSGVAVDARHQ